MNNEIETLYPVKKKNNKIPFLILFIVIIGIVAGFLLKTNLSKLEKQENQSTTEEKNNTDNSNENPEDEPKEETIEDIKKLDYKCVKPQLKNNNYTIDYEYYFLFEENTLISGYTNYIYKFSNLEAFNKFQLPSIPNTELKEESSDPTTLIKIISSNNYYLQEETKADSINSYIKMLESKDYTCEIKK